MVNFNSPLLNPNDPISNTLRSYFVQLGNHETESLTALFFAIEKQHNKPFSQRVFKPINIGNVWANKKWAYYGLETPYFF